jgi:hypothetical protein
MSCGLTYRIASTLQWVTILGYLLIDILRNYGVIRKKASVARTPACQSSIIGNTAYVLMRKIR